MGTAHPIPEGFHTVTPHIVVKDPGAAIDFYKKAFGAEEICRMPGPDGKSVVHAEIKIGDSVIMMGAEYPGMTQSPESLGGTPVTINLYVNDCDATFKRAVDAGASVTMPLADQFWGDRYGKLKDPFGHEWSIATHKEDLSPEEIGKRAAAAFGKDSPSS